MPGIGETVRINGHARIIADENLLAEAPAQGKVPATGLLITVTEAFYHCAKALIRSKLWDPTTQVERTSFPTLGRIIADQTSGVRAEDADANIEESYRSRLYQDRRRDGRAPTTCHRQPPTCAIMSHPGRGHRQPDRHAAEHCKEDRRDAEMPIAAQICSIMFTTPAATPPAPPATRRAPR